MPPARRLFQPLALGLARFSITGSALAAQPVAPGDLWGAGSSQPQGIGVTARRDRPAKEIVSGVEQAFRQLSDLRIGLLRGHSPRRRAFLHLRPIHAPASNFQ